MGFQQRQLQLAANARPSDTLQQVERGMQQLKRARLDGEAQALLKAQAVQNNANELVVQVCAPRRREQERGTWKVPLATVRPSNS